MDQFSSEFSIMRLSQAALIADTVSDGTNHYDS